jgi:hypothetical protein
LGKLECNQREFYEIQGLYELPDEVQLFLSERRMVEQPRPWLLATERSGEHSCFKNGCLDSGVEKNVWLCLVPAEGLSVKDSLAAPENSSGV